VNHISGSRGGIAGVYNRSELLEERRAARNIQHTVRYAELAPTRFKDFWRR
jgi:hypothetical protein